MQKSCESIASSGVETVKASAASAQAESVKASAAAAEPLDESDDNSMLSESPRVPHVGAASGAQLREVSPTNILPPHRKLTSYPHTEKHFVLCNLSLSCTGTCGQSAPEQRYGKRKNQKKNLRLPYDQNSSTPQQNISNHTQVFTHTRVHEQTLPQGAQGCRQQNEARPEGESKSKIKTVASRLC